ncbi:MAG: hypothetical protein SPK00_01515 [Corynebacterium glucuronolyticum]|nr:hypothetical protein [Mycobacteriaceae bacterium]MDY5833420.1 hypothetical protein [Corynebacterium glucuronolyticum]
MKKFSKRTPEQIVVKLDKARANTPHAASGVSGASEGAGLPV